MRTRIFAVVILFIFLIVPFIGYWYFFRQNTSVVTFSPEDPDVSYTVVLRWNLDYKYLPLADKALIFEKECTGICDIILPPVIYDLQITASGSEAITDSITLSLGEGKKYSFRLVDVFTPVLREWIPTNPTLESNLLMNANTSLWWWYQNIGTTRWGKYYALRNIDGESSIGIITPDAYLRIMVLPFRPKNIALDLSREYIIIWQWIWDQYITSLDGSRSIVFPYGESIEIVDAQYGWKVKTSESVYILESGRWKKNPRYTDILDISSTERIGYIDKDDTAKLSLQNLTPGISVLEYIDRTTGVTTSLKKWIEIQWLFHLDGEYAYVWWDGDFFTFSLPHP